MGSKRRLAPWTVLESCVVFSAPPWVSVSADRVRLPEGTVVDSYHQVRLPDFVIMVAYTSEGHILVNRQYKHGAGKVTLALPAGMLEAGEDPLVCARRELLEETGYAADDWCALGTFVENGNYKCGTAYVFLARGTRRIAEPRSGDLEEIETLTMTPRELAAAIAAGDLVLINSIAAFALATNPLFLEASSLKTP